jgi:hypothetical protein
MTLAIMQPYLFPYLGYWQLLALADEFVVYDDVQFIKNGWINRNRILLDGAPSWITLPVQHDSMHLPINRRRFTADFSERKQHVVRKLDHAYRRAPHLAAAMELVAESFACTDDNVAAFVTHTLACVCRRLGIRTTMRMASSLQSGPSLHGADRVFAIAREVGADTFVNPAGGRKLYAPAAFQDAGLRLRFLEPPADIAYPQSSGGFVPFLSVLDAMAFNPPETVRRFLHAPGPL